MSIFPLVFAFPFGGEDGALPPGNFKTGAGRDIALKKLPGTQYFTFDWGDDGSPIFVNTEEHAVMACLRRRRGKWWADTTGTDGSRLYLVVQDNGDTASQLEAYALESLQPLVEAKRIKGAGDLANPADPNSLPALRAVAERLGPGNYNLDVFYQTPGGKEQRARLAIGY